MAFIIDPTTYEENRSHFIFRLKERYGIDLTESEYDELKGCSERLYNINANRSFVLAKIKGQNVYCIRKKAENRHKLGGKWENIRVPTRLVTCLPENFNPPVPACLKIKGYDSNKFEKEINNAIKEVIELEYELRQVGYKEFFTKNAASRYLKRAVHSWHRDGDIDIECLIRYLSYKEMENKILPLLK